MALPEDREEDDPAFMHYSADALPLVEDDGLTARLIAGSALGRTSPLQTGSETLYADVQLARDRSMPIDRSYEERALYTISGEVEVAGDNFGPAQLLVLRHGDAITVRAKSDARFMLFGGAPMGGPRYIWWNFVSSRRERIEAAKEEWARGRFDTVPGDETEFIPLPKDDSVPRRAVGGVYYP
jgi:redox-sensitive bicupin YhaK (pirin superfamily)